MTLPVHVKLTIGNSPQNIQVGEVLQSMLADAGFALEVNAMDFGTSLDAVQRGDFETYLGGWSGLLDADSNSWSFLHSGGPLNFARYSNKLADDMLDQARIPTDLAQRRALYGKLWTQEAQDLPIVYLWAPRYIVGTTAKLSGFKTMPDGLLRLQGVTLAP